MSIGNFVGHLFLVDVQSGDLDLDGGVSANGNGEFGNVYLEGGYNQSLDFTGDGPADITRNGQDIFNFNRDGTTESF